MKKIKTDIIRESMVNKIFRDILYSVDLVRCDVVIGGLSGRLIRESVVDRIKYKLNEEHKE
jgi:hypothetical protein